MSNMLSLALAFAGSASALTLPTFLQSQGQAQSPLQPLDHSQNYQFDPLLHLPGISPYFDAVGPYHPPHVTGIAHTNSIQALVSSTNLPSAAMSRPHRTSSATAPSTPTTTNMKNTSSLSCGSSRHTGKDGPAHYPSWKSGSPQSWKIDWRN